MLKSGPNSPDPTQEADALETLRASQKLIQLGRLAASIAHEINNPLESVSNLLYLIRAEPGLPESVVGYLDLAEREMKRVVTISKQTLNFAREAGERADLCLPELLDEVLHLYRRQIDEKRLRVVQKYTPTEPVRAAPGEMRQVLANLIVNAIEACEPRGCLTLRVRPAGPALRSPGVRVTIADDGTGIPPSVRPHLGEPFFTTKGQGGTGLGLWVSRSIVDRHGGHMHMRSLHISEPLGDSYHGTVFTLFLPLRPPGGGESASAAFASASGPGGGPMLVQRIASRRRKADPSMRHAFNGD